MKHGVRVLFCILIVGQMCSSWAQELELVGSFAGLEAPRDQLLAGPVDMAVARDGRVYVLDWKACDIKVYGPDGAFLSLIGRRGSGPGEMLQPSRLGIVGDSIYVADTGNRRIQVFSTAGVFIRSYEVPITLAGEAICFGPDGKLYVGKSGLRTEKLVQVYDTHGRLLREFGELEGKAMEFLNFTEMKKQIAKGRVPDYLKNRIRIAVSARGEVFVAHQGLERLKKFSVTGQLLWNVRLTAPELRKIYERFLQYNRELMNQPATLPSLMYVNDLAIDRRDNAYLLLNWPEELVIYVYSGGGTPVARLQAPVPEAALLAVSADDRLYVFSRQTYRIYKYRLKGMHD